MTDPSSATQRSEEDVRSVVRAMILDLAPERDTEIGPETRLVDDLGFHSLALLELAFSLEDEFDLEPIDEETARGIVTVEHVEATVLRKIAERDAAG